MARFSKGNVQINGEIFKRWNGGFFGSSNVVINATPLPKPTEGFKAEPFWHPAPFSHINLVSIGGHVSAASVIAPMPALRASRLRVQANDKSIVFHHCTGGIFSALGGRSNQRRDFEKWNGVKWCKFRFLKCGVRCGSVVRTDQRGNWAFLFGISSPFNTSISSPVAAMFQEHR